MQYTHWNLSQSPPSPPPPPLFVLLSGMSKNSMVSVVLLTLIKSDSL